MAFANMLRRSAAAAAPLALRIAGSSRNHATAAVFSKLAGGVSRQRVLPPSMVHFSSVAEKAPKADEKLIRVLETEIDCADEPEEATDVPAGFPFKIEDMPGEQLVKLTRQYNGETIEVEVYMPNVEEGEFDDGKDNDDANEDDDDSAQQSTLPLLVKISKDVGPTMEFSCTATADEVTIESLTIKDPEASDDLAYEGPDFGDLDENLQKAFHKYLNVRGITPAYTNFLQSYMVDKDNKEYKMWLKNLKKFVEA